MLTSIWYILKNEILFEIAESILINTYVIVKGIPNRVESINLAWVSTAVLNACQALIQRDRGQRPKAELRKLAL